MNRVEFLKEVLCADGIYYLFYLDNKRPCQQSFNSIDEFEEGVERLIAVNPNRDMYVAMSSFSDPEGGRKQSNVRARKTLSLDLDVDPDAEDGKHFASKREALMELSRFAKELSLPDAMVVDSGRGIHVHWILDRELPVDEWDALATSLRSQVSAHNFNADPAVSGDSARVFRLPGTINTRNGATARVLKSAAACSVSDLKSSLGIKAMAPTAMTSKGAALLAAMQVKSDYPPADSHVIEQKCAQVSWAVNNQDKVSEPLWYALVGVAAFCEDPTDTAIRWSEKHPEFNADATIRKMEQYARNATGPATCETFKRLRPSGCQGCPFKVVTSPAMLGTKYEEPKDQTVPDVPLLVELPAPYKRVFLPNKQRNGIVEEVEGTDVPVLEWDMYPVSYGYDEQSDSEFVSIIFFSPNNGWKTLTFGHQYLSPSLTLEFAREVGKHGMIIPTKPQELRAHAMVRSYMDALKERTRLTNVHSSMGWKDDFTGFVLGNAFWGLDDSGKATKSINMTTKNSSATSEYSTSGTLDEWKKLTRSLDDYDLDVIKFAILVSLSGPLYAHTGLRGIIYNLLGPTASGKTLALMAAQSVYGNPSKLLQTSNTTLNSINTLMATAGSTLVTMDEGTIVDTKSIGVLAYTVEQGQERGRLTRAGTAKVRREWHLPVMFSSNKSMTEAVNDGVIGDAQLARMMEINVPMPKAFQDDKSLGLALIDGFRQQFGTAAEKWVPFLLEMGHNTVLARARNHRNDFGSTYTTSFKSEERFWETAMINADMGGKLGAEAGVIDFDYQSTMEKMLKNLELNRKYIAGNKVSSRQAIVNFINEHQQKIVHAVYRNNAVKPQSNYDGFTNIVARLDLYRMDTDPQGLYTSGAVMLDKREFKKWCLKVGHSYKTIEQDIKLAGLDATPESGKALLSKGTLLRLPQTYVLGVKLLGPEFESVLTDKDQGDEEEETGTPAEGREGVQAAVEDR